MERVKDMTATSEDNVYLHEYGDTFQYAQDPLEGFTEEFLKMKAQQKPNAKIRERRPAKLRKKCVSKSALSKLHIPVHSFVVNSVPKKGFRLIKISVFDLDGSQQHCDSIDDDNFLLSAQYVVNENGDEIMDQTEKLVSNISKKICNYSYTNWF